MFIQATQLFLGFILIHSFAAHAARKTCNQSLATKDKQQLFTVYIPEIDPVTGLALPLKMPSPLKMFMLDFDGGREISGPQFFVPKKLLDAEEQRLVEELIFAGSDPTSPWLQLAIRRGNTFTLRAGIEVARWRVRLKSGEHFWSEIYTSYEPRFIWTGHSERALLRLVDEHVTKNSNIIGIDFYHFHPMGCPLSISDIGRRGKRVLSGLPKKGIQSTVNAIVTYANGLSGLYRNVEENNRSYATAPTTP